MYTEVLSPDASLIGPDDPPHAYYAKKTVWELGLVGLSELIADCVYNTDYTDSPSSA